MKPLKKLKITIEYVVEEDGKDVECAHTWETDEKTTAELELSVFRPSFKVGRSAYQTELQFDPGPNLNVRILAKFTDKK